MAESVQDMKDEAKRKRMGKAFDDATYLSMGTKRPPAPKPRTPVMADEFQRGKEAGPEPQPMPPRDMMTPTLEEEARMREQLKDERMMRRMGEEYDKSAPRSMKRGLAKGGAVSSASSRADGCAQRGKTKGRFV
jgi:type IV secretory pathway VirB10-like protein